MLVSPEVAAAASLAPNTAGAKGEETVTNSPPTTITTVESAVRTRLPALLLVRFRFPIDRYPLATFSPLTNSNASSDDSVCYPDIYVSHCILTVFLTTFHRGLRGAK